MENIIWHETRVSSAQRAAIKKQEPCVLWFTGLSGAGKSTLANALDQALYEKGYHAYLLDGDNIRHGLCKDLGFSDTDRVENIRRIGEVARLFADAGMIALCAFISPFRSDRQMVRSLFPVSGFIEIYVNASMSVCEKRDPKGLYQKARRGQIKNFTGIDSPYEAPESPEITLNSAELSIEDCTQLLLTELRTRGILRE